MSDVTTRRVSVSRSSGGHARRHPELAEVLDAEGRIIKFHPGADVRPGDTVQYRLGKHYHWRAVNETGPDDDGGLLVRTYGRARERQTAEVWERMCIPHGPEI